MRGDRGCSQHAWVLDGEERGGGIEPCTGALSEIPSLPLPSHTTMESTHESSPSPLSSGGGFALLTDSASRKTSYLSPPPHLDHRWKGMWDSNGCLENPGQGSNSRLTLDRCSALVLSPSAWTGWQMERAVINPFLGLLPEF